MLEMVRSQRRRPDGGVPGIPFVGINLHQGRSVMVRMTRVLETNLVAGAPVRAKVRVVLAELDGGDGEDITGVRGRTNRPRRACQPVSNSS